MEQKSLTMFNGENIGASSKNTDNDHNKQNNIKVDTEIIESDHLSRFVEELSDEQLRGIVREFTSYDDVLELIQNATNDTTLSENIKTLFGTHIAEDPDKIREKAASVEEKVGCQIFEVSFTEPKQDFMDPFCSVQAKEYDELIFTENGKINAEIIEHATRKTAETKSGQLRIYNQWSDAVGKETIKSFKLDNSDPDALGFATPESLPVYKENSSDTPITDIPYIGIKTAENIHPTGDILPVEKIQELTPKQRSFIDSVKEIDECGKHGISMLTGLVEQVEDGTTDAIGVLFDFSHNSSTEIPWINGEKTVGLAYNGEYITSKDSFNPVTEVEHHEEEVIVKGGSITKHFSKNLWKPLEAISKANNVSGNIHIGKKDVSPGYIELPDGGHFTVAPRLKTKK